MEKQELPAWLETLWNVNPRLAESAEKDVERWQKLETSQDQALNLADVSGSSLFVIELSDDELQIVTKKELKKMYESAMEFDGFLGFAVKGRLT